MSYKPFKGDVLLVSFTLLFFGMLLGCFFCVFMNAILSTPADAEKPTSEYTMKKTMDWSKHPNKDKRNYLENIYLNSSKN